VSATVVCRAVACAVRCDIWQYFSRRLRAVGEIGPLRAGACDVIIMSVLMTAGKKAAQARADKEAKKKKKTAAAVAAARSVAANRFDRGQEKTKF